MKQLNCTALILAGGRGERLGSLTAYIAKPAVTIGGKYKIIDFTLNNCKVSGINNIGVLTQYNPSELHSHIKNSSTDNPQFKISALPSKTGTKYSGTADAVYRNIQFVECAESEEVIILSGDHVYEMDYGKLLEFHNKSGADVTIASTPVPFHEAPRFGILSSRQNGAVWSFEEKPKNPRSRLASMGVYVFKWECLKKYLINDIADETSSHDFGKDIIPKMLHEGEKLFTYVFDGYWRDIGTVYSLWAANMDIVRASGGIPLFLHDIREMIELHRSPRLDVRRSIITDYGKINGKISGSVISDNVSSGEGTIINDCVIMPDVTIGKNVKLSNAIIGEGAVIMDGVEIGAEDGNSIFTDTPICSMGISLVAPNICISGGLRFRSNSHIDKTSVLKLPSFPNNSVRYSTYQVHTAF